MFAGQIITTSMHKGSSTKTNMHYENSENWFYNFSQEIVCIPSSATPPWIVLVYTKHSFLIRFISKLPHAEFVAFHPKCLGGGPPGVGAPM